jgi:hypothetical protein
MYALLIFIGIIGVLFVLSLIGRKYGLFKQDEEILKEHRNKKK